MRKDLLYSLKEKKAAISYRKGFPLLFPWLTVGATLQFWSRPKRGGQGWDLLPFLGRKQPTDEGSKEPHQG